MISCSTRRCRRSNLHLGVSCGSARRLNDGIQILDETADEIRDMSLRLVRANYPPGMYSVGDGDNC
jgi:hypothetical protein